METATPTTTATAFTIDDAHKCFGETQALNGAHLKLQRGEWLGLLGPNGAGKTTLVRALAGRLKLDQGDLSLLNTPIFDNSGRHEVHRKFGIVPQEIALYPLLTARENLEVFAALQGIRGADLRDCMKWALTWTGLADRAQEPIKQFSGGMKRRLNIACSVLHQPEVILLDEPTVGVDPQSRQRIWEMLAELRANGAALLLTTHQLDEAQTVCDRIVIMDHGQTIASGTVSELLAQTIGNTRRVRIALDRPVPTTLPESDHVVGMPNQLERKVLDIATELPALLSAVAQTDAIIKDIHIESPTLQDVFLHLTGRELRE